jgi:hypothetical protein
MRQKPEIRDPKSEMYARLTAHHKTCASSAKGGFSLTLTISRWERETETASTITKTDFASPVPGYSGDQPRFSLSQRERAGVRESGSQINRLSPDVCPALQWCRSFNRSISCLVAHHATLQGEND